MNRKIVGVSILAGLTAGIAVLFQNCGGFVPQNQALNASSASSLTTEASPTPTSSPTPTPTPSGSALLQWVEPYTGTPTNYIIEESTDGGSTYFQAMTVVGQQVTTATTVSGVSENVASVKVSGLSPQTYYFRVRSSNAGGESIPSAAISVVVPSN